MKNQLLLAITMATLSLPLIAQHHFPEDSAEWKVYYQKTEGPVTHKALRSHSYNGDTVLMGVQYKKITAPSSKASPGFGEVYLREVDSTQKVYVLLNDAGVLTEYLLYDFSKSTGDTISIPVAPYGMPDTIKWYVFNEGYITIGQQQRRYMELEFIGSHPFQSGDSIYMDRWIEGIGSVRGLLAPFLDDGSFGIGESLRYHLVCFTDKGEGVQYESGLLKDSTFIETNLYNYYDSVSSCNTAPWGNLSHEESVFKNDLLNTYPNPFTEELNLYNPAGSTGTYAMYTTNGQAVFGGELKQYGTITIQTRHLPKGFYILKTKTTENQVLITKILCR